MLLTYFPEVELPVTITVGSRKAFEERNRPLPLILTATYFDYWEEEPADMYTEYIPGFSFSAGQHKALVYWKAGLLQYTYVLVILDKDGMLKDRLVLVETDASEGHLRQGAAMITADREIWTVESTTSIGPEGEVPDQALAEKWSINDDGRLQTAQQPSPS